jgi:hypothetical protein
MLTVVNADDTKPNGSLIEEIVREGARRMLAAALEAEVNSTSLNLPASATATGVVWWCATGSTPSGRLSPRPGRCRSRRRV